MTATIDFPTEGATILQGALLHANGHADPGSTVYFAVTFLKNTVEHHTVQADRTGLWVATATGGLQPGRYVAHATQVPAGKPPIEPEVLPPGAFVGFSVVSA